MIYHFDDKSSTIKHLSVILEVKKLNSQTLRIKELLGQSLSEDLLFYDSENRLTKDLKKFAKELTTYMRHVNSMEQAKKIGFGIDMVGGDEGDGPPPEEE